LGSAEAPFFRPDPDLFAAMSHVEFLINLISCLISGDLIKPSLLADIHVLGPE
jgi:hypothetical protein